MGTQKRRKTVKGPLKNVFMSVAYSKFFSVRSTKFSHNLFSCIFFGRIILKHIDNKKGCGGVWGRAPSKNFKNLQTVVAIIVRYFLNKFYTNFVKIFAPKSECFTKYNAFSSYISEYACIGREAYCYWKGSKLWRNCIRQKHVSKWLVGDASPPLGSASAALISMFLTTTPTSRFGFSMMWGKFCHSCFEITARIALAQFGHFTLQARVWS